MKKSAIIVAGGSGSRMNSELPKQFLLLAGTPILMHSIAAFHKAFPNLIPVVVLPSDQFEIWNDLCSRFTFNIPHQLVPGGDTRFHSVKNGLKKILPGGLVAIHDGVRPLVSASLIQQAFEEATLFGNCIPVVPVTDSMRRIIGKKNRPVNRVHYFTIQTPQVFRSSDIKKAYLQPFSEKFTDDATVLEVMGKTIHLMPGEPFNLKITQPDDLTLAESLLALPFQR